MFPINDALDAILLGGFLFGLLFTIASFALGFADIGADHGVDADGGDFFSGLFNVSALLSFITWCGGIAYLFRNVAEWNAFISVLIGLGAGLVAASAVTWFVVNVLRKDGAPMNPADYELVGAVAKVTSGIRPGGFGEIVYERGGTRHVASARSLNEAPVVFGTEVVVLRVEKGVAVVQPFSELLDEPVP